MIPLYQKVKKLENKFNKIEYQWIPRYKNTQADTLSKIRN